MRAHVVFVLTGIMGAVGLLSPAWAANRFVINNQSLATGSTGNNVPVLADLDQDIFAFSVHIGFDASKLRVTLVQVGSAVAAVSPDRHPLRGSPRRCRRRGGRAGLAPHGRAATGTARAGFRRGLDGTGRPV